MWVPICFHVSFTQGGRELILNVEGVRKSEKVKKHWVRRRAAMPEDAVANAI